jgi:hypothetical protein
MAWFVCACLTLLVGASEGITLTVPAQVSTVSDPLAVVGLGTEATVLVVVSPDCVACVESMDFYKSLLRLSRMDGFVRRLVVIAQDGVIPMKRILDSHDLKPHRLTSGPAEAQQIPVVPTLIILDAAGRRQGTWVGRLTAAQEMDVVNTIGKMRLPWAEQRAVAPASGRP